MELKFVDSTTGKELYLVAYPSPEPGTEGRLVTLEDLASMGFASLDLDTRVDQVAKVIDQNHELRDQLAKFAQKSRSAKVLVASLMDITENRSLREVLKYVLEELP